MCVGAGDLLGVGDLERFNACLTVQADGGRGHGSESKQDKQGSEGTRGVKTG